MILDEDSAELKKPTQIKKNPSRKKELIALAKWSFFFFCFFFLFKVNKKIISLKENPIQSTHLNLGNRSLWNISKNSSLTGNNNSQSENRVANNTNFNIISFFNFYAKDYFYNGKNNIISIRYLVGLYYKNKTIIKPSDMPFLYNLRIFCDFYENETKTHIYSIPMIYKDKYLECNEFFKNNSKIEFGFSIVNGYSSLYFHVLKLNKKEYKFIRKNIQIVDKPYIHYSLKGNSSDQEDHWYLKNIGFWPTCFCFGKSCLSYSIPQDCKFQVFLNNLYRNRNVYNKTHYLFEDFIIESSSADDTYPIFEEMKKRNYSVHYFTEKQDIYDKYCKEKKICLDILKVNLLDYYRFGDFIEKYMGILLRTKAFISGKPNLFVQIPYLLKKMYITVIGVGHGVNYFKPYLFDNNRIYGQYLNDKFLIPPCKKLVSLAVSHGWNETNIIKMNLPRWDKFDYFQQKEPTNITNNSILVMFTWRNCENKEKREKVGISPFYFTNMIKLLKNKKLNRELKKHNTTLYFVFHRYVYNYTYYKDIFMKIIEKNENLVFLSQDEISECVAKTNLIISDFSSVIFDVMARNKPYIIYVPDAKDNYLRKRYNQEYYDIIQMMKNGTFQFPNICKSFNKMIEKVIYYINNNYTINNKMQSFYNEFGFKYGNNTNMFIDYLLQLKLK